MWPNSQESANLITFTEEILIGKLIFYAVKILRQELKENIRNK